MKDYPESYINYLVEFHCTRDYFECHEILEEFWKEQGIKDPLSSLWIGLIQIAVGQYHHRRSNTAGARKMLGKALVNLKKDDLDRYGIDGGTLLRLLGSKVKLLNNQTENLPFNDFDLPLSDPELSRLCRLACEQTGAEWGAASRIDDESLIHRHTRRDRSDVIAARLASAGEKRAQRLQRPSE